MLLAYRRNWPRPLLAAQTFEGLGKSEHADIVEAAADDLQADWKALGIVAGIDRDRRVLRHVPRHGVSDVLERRLRIVDGGGELRRKLHAGRRRRDDVVVFA